MKIVGLVKKLFQRKRTPYQSPEELLRSVTGISAAMRGAASPSPFPDYLNTKYGKVSLVVQDLANTVHIGEPDLPRLRRVLVWREIMLLQDKILRIDLIKRERRVTVDFMDKAYQILRNQDMRRHVDTMMSRPPQPAWYCEGCGE